MTPQRRSTVVAGFDGSDAARAAVAWAAREADARGARLLVARVFEPWWPVSGFPVEATRDFGFDFEALHREADESLTAVVDAVRAEHPGVEVAGTLDTGPTAQHLADVAALEGDLLVIGSSGLSGAADAVLGSTAGALLRTSSVPTVVVRGAAPADGRVVVGIDGSSASGRAVEFAFDHAARHGVGVLAVHAWSDRPVEGVVAGFFAALGDNRPAAAAERLVAEQLGGAAATHPQVPVERLHRDDRPAHALVEAAAGARLLVVGSHGRGALGRLAFGSVSNAVAHRSPCPVAVVRPPDSD